MFKVMAFLTRRPDISREQFIDYYQTRHAPLALRLMPGIQTYRRNFLAWDGATGGAAPDMGFDVVTEIFFADRAAFDHAMQVMAQPDKAAELAADEENLFDRSKTKFIVVDEYASSPGQAS